MDKVTYWRYTQQSVVHLAIISKHHGKWITFSTVVLTFEFLGVTIRVTCNCHSCITAIFSWCLALVLTITASACLCAWQAGFSTWASQTCAACLVTTSDTFWQLCRSRLLAHPVNMLVSIFHYPTKAIWEHLAWKLMHDTKSQPDSLPAECVFAKHLGLEAALKFVQISP